MAVDGTGGRPLGLRLQRALAQAGLGSRRACEQMVADGRVTVNGQAARLGQRADPAKDLITVDGVPLPVREGTAYYLVNKPVGLICSASDPAGRPSVLGLVPGSPRVFTVGRLDVASAGLIVLTNDGELAYQLTHPSFGIEKEYVVEVEGGLSREDLGRLRRGVLLDDGMTAPARAQFLAPRAVRVVVHEGRNRLVRRMFEALGHPVVSLVRTRIGPVTAPELAAGQARRLTTAEVRGLWAAAAGGRARGRVRPQRGPGAAGAH